MNLICPGVTSSYSQHTPYSVATARSQVDPTHTQMPRLHELLKHTRITTTILGALGLEQRTYQGPYATYFLVQCLTLLYEGSGGFRDAMRKANPYYMRREWDGEAATLSSAHSHGSTQESALLRLLLPPAALQTTPCKASGSSERLYYKARGVKGQVWPLHTLQHAPAPSGVWLHSGSSPSDIYKTSDSVPDASWWSPRLVDGTRRGMFNIRI